MGLYKCTIQHNTSRVDRAISSETKSPRVSKYKLWIERSLCRLEPSPFPVSKVSSPITGSPVRHDIGRIDGRGDQSVPAILNSAELVPDDSVAVHLAQESFLGVTRFISSQNEQVDPLFTALHPSGIWNGDERVLGHTVSVNRIETDMTSASVRNGEIAQHGCQILSGIAFREEHVEPCVTLEPLLSHHEERYTGQL